MEDRGPEHRCLSHRAVTGWCSKCVDVKACSAMFRNLARAEHNMAIARTSEANLSKPRLTCSFTRWQDGQSQSTSWSSIHPQCQERVVALLCRRFLERWIVLIFHFRAMQRVCASGLSEVSVRKATSLTGLTLSHSLSEPLTVERERGLLLGESSSELRPIPP